MPCNKFYSTSTTFPSSPTPAKEKMGESNLIYKRENLIAGSFARSPRLAAMCSVPRSVCSVYIELRGSVKKKKKNHKKSKENEGERETGGPKLGSYGELGSNSERVRYVVVHTELARLAFFFWGGWGGGGSKVSLEELTAMNQIYRLPRAGSMKPSMIIGGKKKEKKRKRKRTPVLGPKIAGIRRGFSFFPIF